MDLYVRYMKDVFWPKFGSFFNKDYYDVLGVSRFATDEKITEAYRQLLMKYHRDRNDSPEAASKFLKIKEAYEVIIKQRFKKADLHEKMTCKCCKVGLIAYVFDCGHMVCNQCNASRCTTRCSKCDTIVRQRGFMEYDRSALE